MRALCETLKVSTSGYYDWHDRSLSKRAKANVSLSERIVQAHQTSDETYGIPRIRAELADAGVIVSRKRIAALMRTMHIQGVSRRRAWCVTTERNKRQRPAPDLVKRLFVATDINQLWVADRTYIPTWEGFLYLAVVTDVSSRKVVGWAFGAQMTADLVIMALNMALHTRKPGSVIHHSDQGSQGVFNRSSQHRVEKHILGSHSELQPVSSSPTFCVSSRKCVLIARRNWKTKTEARMAVFSWIESWYNPHRRHSALKYLSPNNFERKRTEKIIDTEG